MTASATETVFSVNSPATTSHNCTLPTGAVAGSVVLVAIRTAGTHGGLTFGSSFIELDDQTATGLAAKKLVQADVDAGSITITSVTSRTSRCSATLLPDAADPAVTPPDVSTIATGATVNPDSSSLTHTGASDDILWLSWFGCSKAATTFSVSAYPTSYSHHQAASPGGVVLIAISARQLVAASEDPGAYTINLAPDAWYAYTIAVHPAGHGKLLSGERNRLVLTG